MVDVVAVVGSGLMVFLCVCVCGSVDGSVCVVLCGGRCWLWFDGLCVCVCVCGFVDGLCVWFCVMNWC